LDRGAGRLNTEAPVIIVGISALYHDSACAVVVGGRLVAAAQEERFTRCRFDRSIPVNAFRACLRQARVNIRDIDYVAYYEDPAARLGRQLWAAFPNMPSASARTLHRLAPDRPFREIEELLGYDGPVATVTHHEAHAASAFYCSGFAESALLTADAVGEWTTTSYGRGGPDGVHLVEEVAFPHSLGLLYSTLTSYLGFEVNSDEYKVMGLAPYGRPRYVGQLRRLVTDLPGGQFRLNGDFFDFNCSDRMYTDALCDLLGAPPREPGTDISSFHEDVAHSIQLLLEEMLLTKARHLHDLTGLDQLSYAGGVALNCVANARLRRDGPFRDIYVQPAAGDAGGAVGAAMLVHHRLAGSYVRERLEDARLGPSLDTGRARAALDHGGVEYTDFTGDEKGLLASTAGMLADGNVVGWCQGRMEFGPRALGARSILADPRNARIRDHINALVKMREAFRPFAPAVVAERSEEFFDLPGPSPFMLDTAQVRDGAALAAITHVDGSARLQTVDAAVDPRFHGLLTAFGDLTGYPVLLNTSFNMRGEPIVADAADALAAFVRCRLDAVVIGDLVIVSDNVPEPWTRMVSAIDPAPRQVSGDIYSFT
jgi:carbamoyltransferase